MRDRQGAGVQPLLALGIKDAYIYAKNSTEYFPSLALGKEGEEMQDRRRIDYYLTH